MLRIKPNNIIAVFFFSYFIQLCDSRKIHYSTREFCVKLHLKTTHRFAIRAISVFRVQYNAEFPCQVMNFHMISVLPLSVKNAFVTAYLLESFENNTRHILTELSSVKIMSCVVFKLFCVC